MSLKMILLFAAFCAVLTWTFHQSMVVNSTKSKRYWIKVDYFWVSLSFFGVISGLYSLHQAFVSSKFPLYQNKIEETYFAYQAEVKRLSLFFNDGLSGSSPQSDTLTSYVKFYHDYVQQLAVFEAKILVEHQYEYLDALLNTHLSFLRDHNEQKQAEIVGLRRALQQLRAAMRRDESELLKRGFQTALMYISPFLLSIAIALRLTKVTAQLKEVNTASAHSQNKNQNNPSETEISARFP